MGNNQTEFARYIRDLMARLDIDSPAEFARRAGTTESTVSRWFSQGRRPSVATLRTMSDRLGPGFYDEMMAAAGYLDGEADTAPTLHPLARQIDSLLGQHSRLSAFDRDLLEKMIGQILKGYPK